MDYLVMSKRYRDATTLQHGYYSDSEPSYCCYPSPVSDPDKSKTIENSEDKELRDLLARLRIESSVQSLLSSLVADSLGGDAMYNTQPISTSKKLGEIYKVPDEFKDMTIASMPVDSLQKLYQRLSLERDVHSIINSLRSGSGEKNLSGKPGPIDPSTPIKDMYHSAGKDEELKTIGCLISDILSKK